MANLIFPALLLLLAFRVWKSGGRERVVRVSRMWILPTVFIVIVGFTIYAQPESLTLTFMTAIVFAAAFAVGFAMGWFRGRTTHISFDAESGALKAKMTPVGLILVAVLLLIRSSVFDWLNAHALDWHIAPTAIVDGFLVLALGLIFGWRIEMFLRCRRLVDTAAADQAA